MDPAKQLAITACGRCGQPEEAHQGRASDADALSVLAALGGPCNHFVASDASLAYAQHLGISDMTPQRSPDGSRGKRNPMCGDCGRRHRGGYVIHPGPGPGSDTARLGAARAREALGITSPESEAS